MACMAALRSGSCSCGKEGIRQRGLPFEKQQVVQWPQEKLGHRPRRRGVRACDVAARPQLQAGWGLFIRQQGAVRWSANLSLNTSSCSAHKFGPPALGTRSCSPAHNSGSRGGRSRGPGSRRSLSIRRKVNGGTGMKRGKNCERGNACEETAAQQTDEGQRGVATRPTRRVLQRGPQGSSKAYAVQCRCPASRLLGRRCIAVTSLDIGGHAPAPWEPKHGRQCRLLAP